MTAPQDLVHFRVVSGKRRPFVCAVTVSRGTKRVVDAAPILQKFVGQPFLNLRRWCIRQGIQIRLLGPPGDNRPEGNIVEFGA